MNPNETSVVSRGRDATIRNYATIGFALLIAGFGALMMTVTSSPQMKGAAMLWIPAALQLMAGVWLGPVRGLIAGGVGAYLAGIFAYGGWGLPDVIMNLIAGGIANSWLPGLLFRLFRINPDFGVNEKQLSKAGFIAIGLFLVILFAGTLPLFTGIGKWSYALAVVLLALASPIAFRGLSMSVWSLLGAGIICIVCCAISALIGMVGVHLSGATWKTALIGTGVGWFLGDTVSCFLGLYLLALYTNEARRRGVMRP